MQYYTCSQKCASQILRRSLLGIPSIPLTYQSGILRTQMFRNLEFSAINNSLENLKREDSGLKNMLPYLKAKVLNTKMKQKNIG